MGANAFEYNVKLNLNAETKMARAQIGELQKELQSISQLKINTAGIDKLTSEIHEASNAALTLQANLQSALNPDTGNLDFSKFISSINKSGNSVNDLAESLLKVGPQGSKAFMSLADSISRAEIPLTRTNKLINGLWDNLKKTAGWQVSSSVIHGIMGTYQQAMGYAQALDKSLTDIRIVTGQSADQMARFAKEANAAAKKLSTTTTDYTNASLIYYQQGLSDSEVKKRSDITIKMANATGTAASKVSDQLTSIWNNFDNGTKSLEHYADVMTALGAATASSTDEIAKGIQKFAAISDTVGLSYEYAASALATITATTRESADTVGNSLKTLFSRIQGLQLGETLDDGTTLNKYSTALAKVGISIKDSSGALRDMNSILDDMGSKWHTLAEDQQMALAQTVGGVRQYTQIMTLMENWDFFKENLNTANTSTGALTMQAEIYADSWEAAQKRFRASMEGMWDSLIDSDGFKSLLNLGSTIVDGITNAIQGLGGTTGIIHTLGGILGNVFNTQISTAIENGIHNIGAIIDPKGTKQRAVDQQQAILQRMSDTVRSSGGYINADGLEGKTYESVLKKQAQETVDRERHRSMMMEENIDLDVKYEEQLKEIRQKKIDSARQIDQGKAQFDSALDSFDEFETQASNDLETKIIEDDIWQQRLSNYSKVQSAVRGNAEDSESYNKVRSQLLSAAAIMSGQSLKDIDFEKEIQNWADRTLNTESEFTDILAQFKEGTAKRTEAEIKAGQTGRNYRLNDLTSDLEKTFSTLLGGGLDSQDQGIAAANQVFKDQLSNAIKNLQQNGLIDPEGKILAGHEDEVINSLSTTLTTMQGNATIFNRERLASQIRSNGGKMSVDAAYQGALQAGQARKVFNQAEQDEAQREADRQALESRTASTISSLVRGTAGLASTTAGLQGFESAFKSDNLFSAITGIGSGILNLKTGKQSYVQGLTDFATTTDWLKGSATRSLEARKEAILQSDQAKYEKYSTDIENIKTRLQKERGTLSGKQRLELLQELGAKQKQRRELDFDPKKVSGPLKSIQQQLNEVDSSKFSKGVTKLSTAFGKLYEGKPEEVAEKINKLSGAFQAAQIAMKITSQGLEYIYNTNQRNATRAATAASQLENAYAMNQRNHSALLASIDEYNQATEKLTDTNLKGAAKSAAIYNQNQSAMDLIMKYGLSESDYSRIGDTIKINEGSLRQAEEDSIERMSVSKYAMNAAKVNAKKEQNDYQEERLEREMGYDEKIAHGVAIGAAGLVTGGVMLGVKSGAILGSIAGPVGTAIGAAAGAAVGLVVGGIATAVTNGAKENSIVDKAVSLTRETGSTAWMDDEDAVAKSGLSERQLKKIKDQRKEIERLAESEYAAEQADRVEKENTANDIIRTNEQLKDFKHANKLQEGLIKQQEDWYSKENMETYNFWDTKKKKIDIAKSLEADLGLGGEQVTWTDNWQNGQLTYTTASGQTGVLDYETMSRMEAAKKGKEGTDDYVDTMMDTYDAIKAMPGGSEDAAAGMLSLLSGGDFESATIKEIEAAQDLINDFDLDAIKNNTRDGLTERKRLAETLGIDTEGMSNADIRIAVDNYAKEAGYNNTADMLNNFKDMQDYTSPIQNLMEEQFVNNESYKDLFAEGTTGAEMFGSMDQATMKEFYSELSFIASTGGTDAGRAYINSMTGMLEGIDPDRMGEAIRALTAVDWSDWDGLDNQVIDILDEFDIKIDNSNEHLQNFVNTIQTVAKSLPNLADSMTSLIQVAGKLEDLKIGDSIDAATMQALKDQGYDLSDETFTTWNGESILTGDIDAVQEGIRNKIAETYGTYMDTVDATRDIVSGKTEAEKNAALDKIIDYSPEELLKQVGIDADATNVAKTVLGEGYDQFLLNKADKAAIEADLEHYKVGEDGKLLYRADVSQDWSTATEATADQRQAYDTVKIRQETNSDALAIQYDAIMAAAEEARDPAKVQEIAEQYVSTFNSYEDAMADETTQKMIADGTLKESDALSYYASKYPELTEYVKAYNEALENNNYTEADAIEKILEKNIAIKDAIANYKALTGKTITQAELEMAAEKIKEQLSANTIGTKEDGSAFTEADLYTEADLVKKAEEAAIAGNAEHVLQSKGLGWVSDIENMSSSDKAEVKGRESAGSIGKYLQQYLGLTEYNILGIDTNSDSNPIIEIIREQGELIRKAINGDTAAIKELKTTLILQSQQGKNLQAKLGLKANGEFQDYVNPGNMNARQKAYKSMMDAANEEEFNVDAFDDAVEEFASAEDTDWETVKIATEAASGGGRTALRQGQTMATVNSGSGNTRQQLNFAFDDAKGDYVYQYGTDAKTGAAIFGTKEEAAAAGVTISETTVTSEDGKPVYTGGGRGGGGGGGGPTKVQVKSAQELMTRYKTTDQKLTNNEMQKTAALQAKDLLYGKSKINQLEKINTLLRKQQQLTADRIEEELDYLESDKEKIIEVLERYNKDAKDEDKISIEFDSQGLISNYKQVIGAWAEELASYYLDGELTAEEGKKAEELQKKIQDFNTLIKDYEDSLNQLASSIEQYETTLYEMLSNDIEAMAHNIEYKIDINNDDISYLDFYMTNIKDSIGSVIDYLELLGSKVSESASQIGIYEQGYVDLVDFINENPLQLWATQGVEGMLTAEQVTTLRSYRDGLMSVYQTALSVRKEIEDQTLKVFDYWNNKIDKNVESISRFTDMLSQFKDIINIVGKDAMGLSNTFMKTFEQQSIDQSFDNIAVNRTQYEHLVQVYEDAQEKLETARASGNERDIEYWEKVVDETQEAMEGAQDALLTTLQHSLNAIAEQFTNAVTIALEEFEESIYKFNGLDGMIADYEQIKEKQDLMVADYEKIYSLNKLNRDLEKTLNNSNILAGKSKLLEFQQKINKINESNVELSQYELEYLQAEYDLKVAEMELENARNSKDTVMLSKDSEGNWSYVYTQNANAVEDAEQKVEDALYKMQQLSYEYTDEMSQAMMSISQQMRDEIAALSIQDFASAEEYYNEISRIQDKYSEQLTHREDELNKAISNNAALYEEDWANYSAATGYKISADSEWIDSFKETTLGGLIGSGSDISNFSALITQSTNEMNEALGKAASTYFVNADKALNTYGSSLKGFGATVSTTTSNIINSSKNATKEVTSLANTLVDKFAEISDTVESELAEWTEEIGNKLEELLETIKEINKLIADSASKELPDTNEIIGQEEAVQRLQSAEFENKDFNNWTWSEEGQVAAYGDKGLNLVEFNAELVQKVNDALQAYANTPTTDTEERAKKLEELNKLIKDYWTFKRILEKIYDPTNIKIEDLEVPDTGTATQMATGGYTGEWGNEGKWAVLHEKELVLSADDTANFLDALSVSRDLVNSMIEMNAQASSLGLGNMVASSIQDTPQTIEQQVSITADFPNATDKDEIMEAFDNLINTASQYANRYKL